MSRLFIFFIRVYQKTLSPDHGWLRFRYPYGYCQYYPTCSDYTKQAIEMHGSVAGLRLAALRLLRCHPWSSGGIDHVPLPLSLREAPRRGNPEINLLAREASERGRREPLET